jgi:cysteine desulfurase
MYANNEVGSVQPIKQIAATLETIRQNRKKSGNTTPLYLHTDAAQAANYLDLHVHRLGVDLMTVNGGKIYGPKQSGALFVRSGIVLEPLLYGGGQEQGKRSGTENVAAFIGFAKALELASEQRHKESERLQELQAYCIQQLENDIPNIVINGSIKRRLPNNVHLTVSGTDNERLLYGLEDKGVICAAGSACSASKEEASHVLLAMGISENDARSSLRLSFGRQTTKRDIEKFIECLKAVI